MKIRILKNRLNGIFIFAVFVFLLLSHQSVSIAAPSPVHPLRWFDYIHNDEYTWIGLKGDFSPEQLEDQYQEFLHSQIAFGFEPFGATLADDHVLTQYIQKILDWADRSAKELYKRETGKNLESPRPIAKLIQSANMLNAFVSPAMVCTDIEFGEIPISGIGVFLEPDSVVEKSLNISQHGSRPCMSKPEVWSAKGILDYWMESEKPPKCSLKLVSQGDDNEQYRFALTNKTACRGAVGVNKKIAVGGSQTIIKSTSQFIHFSTDLFTKLDDPRILFYLVSHELGHYYLGHSTDRGASQYDYWYLRASHKYGKPPRKEQASKNDIYLEEAYLHQEALAKGLHVSDLDFNKNEFSDRLSSFLILGIGAILKDFIEKENQPVGSVLSTNNNNRNKQLCSTALALLPPQFQLNRAALDLPELIEVYLESSIYEQDPIARNWVTPILDKTASSKDLLAFSEYKKALQDCSFSVFVNDEIHTAGGTLSSKPFALALKKYLMSTRVISEDFFKNKVNLHQILEIADQEAKKIDRIVFRLLPVAKQNILGFYTAEQAADEFALKIATMGGMSAIDVLEGVFGFMKATEDSLGVKKTARLRKINLELDYQACYQAYQDSEQTDAIKGFNLKREGDFISLGKLSDKHHSDCYRAFNLWRLIQIDQEIENTALGIIPSNKKLLRLPTERFFQTDSYRFNQELNPLIESWKKIKNSSDL